MIDFGNYNPSEEDIKFRINNYLNNELSELDKKQAFKTILSCIDLTTLEGSDTKVKIFSICERAKTFNEEGEDIPNVAAVCFYTPFIKLAKKVLKDTGIKVSTVAAGFPGGQLPISLKMEEVKYAVEAGADEIDIVISRGKLLANTCQEVYEEILVLKDLCNGSHLKVILETGELETVFKIRKASEIAIKGGADFIKTSTGKIKPAATPEAFLIMLDTIKEYYDKTGKKIGVVATGSIDEPEDAIMYFQLVKHVLGDEWLTKKLFRINASSLANKLVAQVRK